MPEASALVTVEEAGLTRWCASVAVEGTIAQSARLELAAGQALWCAKGSLLAWEGASWRVEVPGGAVKAARRALSGAGLGLVRVTADRDGAVVLVGAGQPGRLAAWDLSRGPVLCTAGSFVAALGEVDVDLSVARGGAALFGGAGLFLQRLSGAGTVLVHGLGDFVERRLGPGERLLVSTGHLALFSAEVGYGVRGTGGCRNALFGGEGLFSTELTGPGVVLLQTLRKRAPSAQGASAGE